MSEEPNQPRDRRFEVLIVDYQAAREDERNFGTLQAASIGLAISLLAIIAAGISQTCGINESEDCLNLPPLFLAALPIGPAAVGAFLMIFGAAGTVRSYYLRALERELQKYAPGSFEELASVGPASFTSLVLELTSLRRGRLGYRLLTNFIFLAVVIVFGGVTYYIWLIVPESTRILMAIFYIPFTLVLFAEIRAVTVGGRSLFIDAVERLAIGSGGALPKIEQPVKPPPQRGLASYLLIPRPEDWSKWLIAPGVYLLIAWATGSFGDSTAFLVLWLTMEFLIYEARYQWNDLRGLAHDQRHPERKARARLPIGSTPRRTRRNIMASIVVAIGRLGLAVVVGALTDQLLSVLLLTILILGVAIFYERLRLVPIAEDAMLNGIPIVAVGLWLMVGLGYAIRAGVALFAMGIALNSSTGLLCLVCLASFGIMFVLLTWVLEAANLSRVVGERWHATADLFSKPHLGALMRFTGHHLERAIDDSEAPDGGKVKILERQGKKAAPWNLAALVALVTGTWLGSDLSEMRDPMRLWALLIAAGGAILLALMPATLWRILVFLGGAGALGYVAWTAPVDIPWLVFVPWLVIGIWYIAFRASSYHDLKYATQNSIVTVVGLGASGIRSLVGRETWKYARFGEGLARWAKKMTGDKDLR